MNCPKCGRQLFVSHISKNENGNPKKILVCMNKNCSKYSNETHIKLKK